jgi:porin
MRQTRLPRWCRLALSGLLLLWLGGAALATEGEAGVEEGIDAVAAEEAMPEGMIPLRDYSGDVWERRALTGDWGGTRQEWAEKGFTFELDWLQVGQGIVKGGLDEGWAYAGNLDYWFRFDLMRMGLVPGAAVLLRGQSRYGNTVNAESGQLWPVNSYSYFPFTSEVDQDVPIAITELAWMQAFSEQFMLLFGKLTMMRSPSEFAGGEGRTQFMNMQLLWPVVLAQLTPYSTLAVEAMWLPSPNVNVTGFVANLGDSSTTSGFDQLGEGAFAGIELDLLYQLGDLQGGTSVIYIYAFDADFTRVGGVQLDPGPGFGPPISVDSVRNSWGLNLTSWQYLYQEEPGGELDAWNGVQDLEGLGAFLVLGVADKEANPTTFTIAGGLSGRGSIPGRDNDTWGIGYFYNDLQDHGTFSLNGFHRPPRAWRRTTTSRWRSGRS